MGKVRKKRETHGLSKHRLYSIYTKMLDRCYNPLNKEFRYYGGKGVRVCDEWRTNIFSFFEWAFDNGYAEKLQIDKDIKGNGLLYCPQYCSWVTRDENMLYRSNSVYIEFEGKTLTMAEWSRETNLHVNTIRRRVTSGWSPKKTLTTPPNRGNVTCKKGTIMRKHTSI